MKRIKLENMRLIQAKFHGRDLFSRGIGLLERVGVISVFKNDSFQKWSILIILSISMAVLLYPQFLMSPRTYHIGDVANRDIKAIQDYLIEDEISTQKRRMEAMEKSPAVYDFDETVLSHIRKRLNISFQSMRALYEKGPMGVKTRNRILWAKKKEFENLLGTPVKNSTFQTLVKGKFSRTLEETIFELIQPYLKVGIIKDRSALVNEKERGIILRGILTRSETLVQDVEGLWDLKTAKRDMRNMAEEEFGSRIDPKALKTVREIAQSMILPNLTFNKKATEEKRVEAGNLVKPVFFQVKKGEIIVREGERIDEGILKKLDVQAKMRSHKNMLMMALGSAFLVGILLFVAYKSARLHITKFASSTKDVFFLAIVLLFLIIVTYISSFIADGISRGYPYIPQNSVLYCIPIAVGGMLVTIFLGIHTAITFSFIVSVCCALLIEHSLQFFIYLFIGSLTAAHGVIQYRERGTLIKVGLLVGLVNIAVIIGINMLNGTLFSTNAPIDMMFGVIGGVFVGIIGTGLSPLIEMSFRYPSQVKLLELISVDQPLLKELMVQSPGTYHHSVLVSNLAEAGAEAINANSLLAKVSGYYHDIGKIKKPMYFVENQRDSESRHEKLAPSMSALILISHVRDGIELAKQYGLGERIIDIIREHHGTSLISFFYEKAKRLRGSNHGSVKVEDFRYPGPKPQTKEAGLVMLADAVEAATRTLVDPTPARVQGTVQKIINGVFSDGQLDECELTLRDLHKIAKSFNKILSGIFHHRIEYPEPAVKTKVSKRKQNNDMDKQRPKQDKDKQEEPKKDGRESLKRLGM
ncbi:MAG TPA: HDIG domain-containing protein [Syntrophaceae bacterium]|nr:HDIG domain-containing protein [Syntrophaceae bacterium]